MAASDLPRTAVPAPGSGRRDPRGAAAPDDGGGPAGAADPVGVDPADAAATAATPGGVGGWVERRLRRLDRAQQRSRSLGLVVGVVKKFGDDQAGNLAALVAYYSFFSLFPLLLLLTTIVGYVLADDVEAREAVVNSVLDRFPGLGEQLATNIGQFQGSGWAVVIGALGALWGGLGALGAMQNAMNAIWGVRFDERPPFLVEKLRSLIMLVVLGAGALATTVVTNVAGSLQDVPLLARALVTLLTLGLNVGLFLLAFKVLTRHDVAWRVLLPGAALAGLAFIVLQSVGGWYVGRTLTRATPLYGTFAVVLGLLAWLYIQAQVTMFAAELNVVVERRLYPRSLITNDRRDLTPADERALASYARTQQRHPSQRVDVTFVADDGDGPAGRPAPGDGDAPPA